MTPTILSSDEGHPGLPAALAAAAAGQPALDIVERSVREVESDPAILTVGYGGAPNILGEMELDASIMDGRDLRCGSVGALKGFAHPISVARLVLERLPHVFLAGEGAARFAKECHAEERDLLTPAARAEWQAWLAAALTPEDQARWPNIELARLISGAARKNISHVGCGTTTILVKDRAGDFAGGVSTSGWAYKYPGRLGDSPVIGAGLYVDNRYGGASCTHGGEMTIRAGSARAVVLYMKKGASVREACHEAFDDLRRLRGQYLGPVIIHAMDAAGEVYVLSTGGEDGDCYWLWREGMKECERHMPAVEAL